MNILIPDRPIAFNRDFVSLGIGVTGALFLSQGRYWSKRTKDEDGWFYKTVEEWTEETGLTAREQRTVKDELVGKGYLVIEKRGLPARNYFLFNWDKVADDLFENDLCCRNDSTGAVETPPLSITETTTESEATASNPSFEEFLDTTNTVSDYEGDGEVAQLVFRRDGRAISEKVLRREYEKAHPAPSKRPLNAPRLRDSFDFDTWLMALKDSPKKEDKIVALIWKEKGYRFDNYEQWRAQMGMDGVWAKKLIGYSGQQILDAIEKCRHDSEKGGYEWKSSTVVKKIAETTI